MLTDIGAEKFGMSRYQAIASAPSAAANGAVNTAHSLAHADNPAAWLLGIVAVTVGLAAFSTTVRVGNVRASVAAGHTGG